jgi:GTPase
MNNSLDLTLMTKIGVAFAGSVDSGKSTFAGVLISKDGEFDDGNGFMRNKIAVHNHEKQSGKTSAISTRTVLFGNNPITLIDMCGHEKYFGTTTYGIACSFPDYAFLIISAHREIVTMTDQHFRLLMAYSVPVIIIVTHVDSVPNCIYLELKKKITKYLKQRGGKTEFINDDKSSQDEEIFTASIEKTLGCIKNIVGGKQLSFPVITVSNKTGYYIKMVKQLISQFQPRDIWNQITTEDNSKIYNMFSRYLQADQIDINTIMPPKEHITGSIFYIENCYAPPGIGLVVAGINRGNDIKQNDIMYIGPFGKEFIEFRVKGLHNNSRNVMQKIDDHMRGCIAIAKKGTDIRRKQIQKGTVILSGNEITKHICFSFKAIITIFATSLTVKTGYAPVLHLNNIRQTAKITIDPSENKGKEYVNFNGKTTNYAIVTFRFSDHSEYINPHEIFTIRSGSIHGVGLVINPISLQNDPYPMPDNEYIKKLKQKLI